MSDTTNTNEGEPQLSDIVEDIMRTLISEYTEQRDRYESRYIHGKGCDAEPEYAAQVTNAVLDAFMELQAVVTMHARAEAALKRTIEQEGEENAG